MREATSTHHEWLEDELLPNQGRDKRQHVHGSAADTDFVAITQPVPLGDQIQVEARGMMLVTGIATIR